jgi:hypothetical protein
MRVAIRTTGNSGGKDRQQKEEEERGRKKAATRWEEEGRRRDRCRRSHTSQRRQRANSGLRQSTAAAGTGLKWRKEERRWKEAKQQQGNASVGSNSWTSAGS